MNKQKKYESTDGLESLSAEDEKISRIVRSLDRVSAPDDFEFRLKARLAQSEHRNRRARQHWLPIAVPVAAALILTFVLYGAYFFLATEPELHLAESEANGSASEITVDNFAAAPEREQLTDDSFNESATAEPVAETIDAPPLTAVSPAETHVASVKKNDPKPEKPESVSTREKDSGGGYLDTAVKTAPVTLPNIMNANTTSPPPINDVKSSDGADITGIFKTIGVETVREGANLKVRSVQEKSVADLAGVKTGDVITAVDGRKIDDQAAKPVFEGKTLTVSREGKTVVLELKPN